MKNGAYVLAFIAGVAGFVLLTLAEQGAGLYTSLGTVLLLAAVIVAAIGKVIEWLRHVRDGAIDSSDHP